MLAACTGARIPHARALPASTAPGLLMHFDGDLTEVLRGRSMAGDVADLSTVAPTFGSGALARTYGTGSSLTTTQYTEDFSFGTGPFTVAFWVRFEDYWNGDIARLETEGGDPLWGLWVGAGEGRLLQWQNYIVPDGEYTTYSRLRAYWSPDVGSAGTPSASAMVLLSRDDAGVLRFFLDGVLLGSMTDATDYSAAGWGQQPHHLVICDTTNDAGGTGHIDDLLILPGVCLYDTAFTPPTAPFALSDWA